MCSECYAKEQAAIQVTHTVEQSRKIDDAIEIKPDIFAAATVSFVELMAAIQHDDTVPTDDKGFALVREADRRIQIMRAVIIEQDQIQLARKNEMHAWLTQTREVASKMRADQREKIKQYDLSYTPTTPKSPKSKPVKTGADISKGELRKAVNEAAAKYQVDASVVRMMLLSRHGLTPETAAKELAGLVK
jgi:hypothetical protein